jgi:16S rRNA (adenine1518-N6/adenine1519-N6)-dimethyltransferase
MAKPYFPPLKSLSQNFLRDETIAKNLVARLPLTSEDRVVELGAGRGAITFLLAEKAAQVLAVEIDAGHSAEVKKKAEESRTSNIEVVHADILKADWQEWARKMMEPFYIVGNLPYHISTPILFKIIENSSFLKGAYVMLQKEVADRLLGQPGEKTYGVLTVLIGYYAQVRSIMQLRPGSFYPKPKVSSTFVELLFRPNPTPTIEDEGLFRWVVRAAFGQRRKQIKNALTADGRFSVSLIEKALDINQINTQRRGETLTISQFVTLANTLFALHTAIFADPSG